MVRWPFVILWRVTHFSKTAQPRTVPNTDTGKTYLLMTDERKCYFHSWSDNTAAAQGYARVLLASSTTTNQPRGGRTQWRCGKCSVILVRNRNAESDFFLLMVNWFNWFVWCLLLFQKHLYDQPNYKRWFFFLSHPVKIQNSNANLICQLHLQLLRLASRECPWDEILKIKMQWEQRRIGAEDEIFERTIQFGEGDVAELLKIRNDSVAALTVTVCPCKRELK